MPASARENKSRNAYVCTVHVYICVPSPFVFCACVFPSYFILIGLCFVITAASARVRACERRRFICLWGDAERRTYGTRMYKREREREMRAREVRVRVA